MAEEKVTFHCEIKTENGPTWLIARHEGYGAVVILKSDRSDQGHVFYISPEDAGCIGGALINASNPQPEK